MGNLTRLTSKTENASLPVMGGTDAKQTAKRNSGLMSAFSGLITGAAGHAYTFMASMALMDGSIVKTPGRGVAATMGFAGTIARQGGRAVLAAMSFSGLESRFTSRTIAAAMAPFGNPFLQADNVFFGSASGNTSFSFTVRPDAESPCLVVDVIVAATSLVSVTYNGVSVPQVQTTTFSFGGSNPTIWQGVLAGCATGSNSIVFTFSGTGDIYLGVRSFTGVDQNNPVSANLFSSLAAQPNASIAAYRNGWIVDAVASTGNTGTNLSGPASPQVNDGSSNSITTIGAGISHQGPVVGGSISDGWATPTSPSISEGVVGIMALKPANREPITFFLTKTALAASMASMAGSIAKQKNVAGLLQATMLNFGNNFVIDNIYAPTGAFASVSGFSDTFFISSGLTNPAILVQVVTKAATAPTVTSVTYNGVSVPNAQTFTATLNGTQYYIWQGVLAGCATGSNTLAATLSTTGNAWIGAYALGNIDQTNPVNRFGASTNTNSSLITITLTADSLLFFAGATDSFSLLTNTPQFLNDTPNGPVGQSHCFIDAGPGTFTGAPFAAVAGPFRDVSNAGIALKLASPLYNVSKQTNENLPASMGFNGTVGKGNTYHDVAATMAAFSGAVGKATTWHNLVATMGAFAGAVGKQTARGLLGAMATMGGTIGFQFNRSLAASMDFFNGIVTNGGQFFVNIFASMGLFAGSETRQMGKGIAAGTAPTSGANGQQTAKTGNASLTFSGAVGKQPGISFAAAMSFGGTIAKQALRALRASMAPFNGLLSVAGQTFFVTINASMVAFSAVIDKTAGKGLSAATASFSATLSEFIAKGLPASMGAFAGQQGWLTVKSPLLATLPVFTGTVGKQAGINLPASMQVMNATMTKQVSDTIAAGMAAFAAGTTKAVFKMMSTTMAAFSGNVGKQTFKVISAAMALFNAVLAAQFGHQFQVTFSASMAQFNAFMVKQANKGIAAATAPMAGAQVRNMGKGLTAGLTFSAGLGKQTFREFVASMANFGGNLAHGFVGWIAALFGRNKPVLAYIGWQAIPSLANVSIIQQKPFLAATASLALPVIISDQDGCNTQPYLMANGGCVAENATWR